MKQVPHNSFLVALLGISSKKAFGTNANLKPQWAAAPAPASEIVVNTLCIIPVVLLTMISDAGAGAAAHCGFIFAFVPKTFLDELLSGAAKKELCGA